MFKALKRRGAATAQAKAAKKPSTTTTTPSRSIKTRPVKKTGAATAAAPSLVPFTSLMTIPAAPFSAQAGATPAAPGGHQSSKKKDKKKEGGAGDDAEGGEGTKKKEKKENTRTWLMVHADIQFRQLTGPLIKKATNNADRKKARQEQMKDLLIGQETIEKLVPRLKDQNTKVWYRKFGEKAQPQLVSIGEAYKMAKVDDEWAQITMLRSSSQRPAIPDNIKGVADDNVLPVWAMNVRNMLEDLYEKDTDQVKGTVVKEVQINATITPDDLLRKVQQAIEFLLDGATVRMTCSSKSVGKLQSWVESNTYFSADEIKAQASDALTAGRVEFSLGDKGGRAQFQISIAEAKIKAANPQREGEADNAYKSRINALVEQERVNFEGVQAKKLKEQQDKQRLVEGRMTQAVERIMNEIKQFTTLAATEKANAQKAQKDISFVKSHPDYKTFKALKPGQFLPQYQKKLNLISKQIEGMEKELSSWRKALVDIKKGAVPGRIPPYPRLISADGVELTAAQTSAAGRKAQENDIDYSVLTKVVMGGRKGGGDDDDGHDDAGGDDDNHELKDAPGEVEEEALQTRSTGKMSKRQLEEKKMATKLEKLTPKERVAYLASVMSKQTYDVMGDVVEILGKVSTIMQMERAQRKKDGVKLTHGEMSPEQYEALSNKDKKRYNAKMAAAQADPNSLLRLEIDNAFGLFQKGRYVYNDVLLEQQTKKPFWLSHDGGATPEEARRKSNLTLTISKSALQDPKKM